MMPILWWFPAEDGEPVPTLLKGETQKGWVSASDIPNCCCSSVIGTEPGQSVYHLDSSHSLVRLYGK